jgi:hypothetical protein
MRLATFEPHIHYTYIDYTYPLTSTRHTRMTQIWSCPVRVPMSVTSYRGTRFGAIILLLFFPVESQDPSLDLNS